MSPTTTETTTTKQQKPVQRKKKAARACVHCQKAHLTCDDSRPCQRCIKRDLASTCMDGVRKKAKYLQDTDDSMSSTSNDSRYTQPLQNPLSTQYQQQPNYLNGGANQLLNLDSLNYGFGSNATNLEYSVLSNMLNTTQFLDPTITDTNCWKSPTNSTDTLLNGDPILFSPQQIAIQKVDNSPKSIISTPPPRAQVFQSRINSGYTKTLKPFSYADGYHYLINYVKQKMGREDLMRISRALALFRPSVLASMMNLTEDDLIFTEKCLQRTLLEYEKLITYSGTPTVIWRRTGEIVLVGKEFSLLTQWPRDSLLSKKTYIYELMADSSAVEYWEKYASHAFDNTDSAVYSSCIILSPTKRVVPCTFCFTIKRDIFDLPSVIVGNFLPILS